MEIVSKIIKTEKALNTVVLPRVEMLVYQVKNLEIKCRVSGKGPKVLLLHGFGGGPTDWKEVVEGLEAKYQVIVPNLSVFFTNPTPLSYSQQVEALCELLVHILPENEKLHLVGTSYGGTLSFGLRYRFGFKLSSHTLINPMPFNPLVNLKNFSLKSILFLSRIPGVLASYAMTGVGQRTIKALGQIFHMGIRGKKKLSHFNKRKVFLIEKAMKRFSWINLHEDWDFWQKSHIHDDVNTLILYSQHDQLFSRKKYVRFAQQFNNVQVKALTYSGHMVVRLNPKLILSELKPLFLDTSEPGVSTSKPVQSA